MGSTILQKIVSSHAGRRVVPGDVVSFKVDVRVARDMGGAGVVEALLDNALPVDDPGRTFFTFDYNPVGPDQKHAANRRFCREFARDRGIGLYDMGRGIGTHVAMEEGLVAPGRTFVSTDSHANLVGAVGALGLGMGDQDIAHAFAFGSVWLEVPPTVKVLLKGDPGPLATAKDLALAVLKKLGKTGLLGLAAEVYGDPVETLSLSSRITMASMGTEMGAIAVIFPPSPEVLGYCQRRTRWPFEPVYADADAEYRSEVVVDVDDLRPLVSRPGRADDVVEVKHVEDRPVDSVFIGSCANAGFEDLSEAADVLRGRHVADGVLLRVVPATDDVWKKCLDAGIVAVFKEAGAVFESSINAAAAEDEARRNCAGEVTVSAGLRNSAGVEHQGDVYLASPVTAAASAAAGAIADVEGLSSGRVGPRRRAAATTGETAPIRSTQRVGSEERARAPGPMKFSGRVWALEMDDIDTDMIYHNSLLAVTDKKEMGKYAFGNLTGWEDFSSRAKPGDIIVAGRNFGCGSSRQHAVDCLKSLGIAVIIARSFGAIYRRNAINAGLPVLEAELAGLGLRNGDKIWVDLRSGHIDAPSRRISIKGTPFSKVQKDIYRRGGLLKAV
jgi:3-isopropylmalate dehydratase small subunit